MNAIKPFTMYLAFSGKISERVVVKETPTKVWVKDSLNLAEYPALKVSSFHAYFHTWEEARQYLILKHKEKTRITEVEVKLAAIELLGLEALQDPTKTEEKTA